MTTNGGLDPRVMAQAIRAGLIHPDEAARFLGAEHPEPPPDATLIWRVNYWRGTKTEPKWEVFRTLGDAKNHARKAARYRDSGPGGRVVRVEIEEALIRTWAVVDRLDLHPVDTDDNDTQNAPQPEPEVVELPEEQETTP